MLGKVRRKALIDAIKAQCHSHCPGPDADHGIGDYFSHCNAYGIWTLIPKNEQKGIIEELKNE